MKTTRESAREESHKKLTHHLQYLLEKNYDAEKDFKSAREHVENPALKEFFKKQAVLKNHFATEIDKQIHSLNEHPKDSGSKKEELKRTWINFKSSIEKDTDESLLEACIRGEKNRVEEYESKLRKSNFPAKMEEVLRSQLVKMRESISKMKMMKDNS